MFLAGGGSHRVEEASRGVNKNREQRDFTVTVSFEDLD